MAEEQLSFIIADLRRFTAEETRALALDVQANLQHITPRDTGWARANWVMSLGAPWIDYRDIKGRPGPAQVAAAAGQQAESVSQIAAYDDASRGAIFTTNNVPYITRLNEGWSKQAGAAFVQRAVGQALMERETAR